MLAPACRQARSNLVDPVMMADSHHRIENHRVDRSRFWVAHQCGSGLVDSPTVMVARLDHLTELTRRHDLRLGVIPLDRPLTMHARHVFHLYETHTVIVGTESGTVSSRTQWR
jgi:hypothetical protein